MDTPWVVKAGTEFKIVPGSHEASIFEEKHLATQQVFMGALDRFDFELAGKKEKYIPCDNYHFTDRNVCSTEDGFQAGSSENYDKDGKLIRMANSTSFLYFEAPGMHSTSNIYLDLQNGVWVSSGTMTCSNCGEMVMTEPVPPGTFDPDAMSGAGIH